MSSFKLPSVIFAKEQLCARLLKGDEDYEEEEHYVSPIYSLAIQQESLWGLSGTESGNINLYSLRHEPGQLRHVLRRHTAAVSAMALTNDDTDLISGGWDRSVHQWDLNTGQVVRSFPGHTGQVSSISFRPLQLGQKPLDVNSPTVSIRASALSQSPSNKAAMDIGDTTPSFNTPSSKAGHSANTSPVKNKSPLKQQIAARNATQQSRETSADEEREATPGMKTLESGINGGASAKITPYTTPMAPKETDTAHEGQDAAEDPATMEKSNDADGSLFGEENTADSMELERDLNEALGLGVAENSQSKAGDGMADLEEAEELLEPDKPSKAAVKTKSADKSADADADSDGDSLFGGDSGDGDADADGEADIDAEGEDIDAEGEADAEGEDEDADGEDDDAPLATRLAGKPTPSMNTIELPGSNTSKTNSPSVSVSPNKINGKAVNGAKDINRKKALPKPAFGGTDVTANFDGDVSKFSNDILLTTTLGGQVTLWDRRVPSYPGSLSTNEETSSSHKGVRALALPDRTPPWCMSACWNSRGDKIYVGRRNETVDEWDLRMIPDAGSDSIEGLGSTRKGNARFARSLRLPPGSGSVTAVTAMPNGRHLVCGSYDNVRLWDTQAVEGKVPFRIVAGHHGGVVSNIIVDPTCRFLFTSSGDRGWLSTSTEAVLLHEIQSLL